MEVPCRAVQAAENTTIHSFKKWSVRTSAVLITAFGCGLVSTPSASVGPDDGIVAMSHQLSPDGAQQSPEKSRSDQVSTSGGVSTLYSELADSTLPPIKNKSWGNAFHRAITIVADKSADGYRFIENDTMGIPKQYFTAAEAGVNDPLVRQAFAVKAVKKLIMSSVSLEGDGGGANDNGKFYPEDHLIVLNVSGKPKSRLFHTGLDITEVVDHEGIHGLTERFLSSGNKDEQAVLSNCIQLNATTEAAYLLGPAANEISTMYDESAKAIEKESRDFPSMDPTEKAARKATQTALEQSAAMINSSDEMAITAGLIKRAKCTSANVSIYDLPAAILPAKYADLGVDEINITQEDTSLLDAALDDSFEQTYGCITDSNAIIGDLTDNKYDSSAGHPRDDTRELSTSAIVSIHMNPTYVDRCIAALSSGKPNQARILSRLIGAVIDGAENWYPGTAKAIVGNNGSVEETITHLRQLAA